MRGVTLTGAAAAAGLALVLSGCGGGSDQASADEDPNALTVYNAQHKQLLEEMLPEFTKETGIKVKLRNGADFELANQIVQEGAKSPADVFLTENSPAMTLVDSKGLFAKLDQPTLTQVPSQFVPADGDWTGFAARSTVLVYNTDRVSEADLPASIVDLPEWGRSFAFAPSGADFQAIVSAVLALKGEPATETWLDGLKAKGKVYQNNIATMKAVNSGEVDAGVIYHYYWYRDQAEAGSNSSKTKLHFFGNKDPGAFVSVSGAGVLKSSDQPTEAQQLVKFLSSQTGQRVLANSYAMEYPLNPDVPPNTALKPISELDPPAVDLTTLNGPKVVDLMQNAGLL